jgi:predicted  nucleic acid-binding Zn-ribbon protein
LPDFVKKNYLLLAEEIQSSENESDSERVAELESKVKELEEKVQQLQLQLDEVRTERDRLEQARVEMEADREEEVKIIERVMIWLHFILAGTLGSEFVSCRNCNL